MKSFSKTNFVKVLGATTLATLMATAGIFAFAPFRASTQASSNSILSNNLNNSTTSTTESAGLITPRADDPILFTTESGLEIKKSNTTAQGTISSGSLKDFYYFQTTGDDTYTWVIIGIGCTPKNEVAGTAIKSDTNCNNEIFNAFVRTNMHYSVSREMVYGEVLCVSNDLFGPVSRHEATAYYGSGNYPAYGAKWSTSTLKQNLETNYSNDVYGLINSGLIINLTALTSREASVSSYNSNQGYVQSVSNVTTVSSTAHLFLLGGVYESFAYDDYLTNSEMAGSNLQCFRGMTNGNSAKYGVTGYIDTLDTAGVLSQGACTANNYYYRIAFVWNTGDCVVL